MRTLMKKFERTLARHIAGRKGRNGGVAKTPEGRIAEIIVLDQFSRNMFRGTPQAFAEDARALELAKEAIAAGDDKKLPRKYRHFLYTPFMYSESRGVHKKAFWLFLSLWNPSVFYLRSSTRESSTASAATRRATKSLAVKTRRKRKNFCTRDFLWVLGKT